MAGEKRFRTSLFGFKKADVNYYIEKILKEFENRLKAKDAEIDEAKEKGKEYRLKYEGIVDKAEQIETDRSKIASVLIKAEEKAEEILAQARERAIEEKADIEKEIEQEKERLVDAKLELKKLKDEVIGTLRKYENQLGEIIEEE
jgi:cell division initiation protein